VDCMKSERCFWDWHNVGMMGILVNSCTVISNISLTMANYIFIHILTLFFFNADWHS